MDIGTAAFVFHSSIVAGPRITSSGSIYSKFKRTFVSSIPTLLFGFGRAVVLKAINYQEHVSEYGVHWNFFVTLSILPFLTTFHSIFLSRVPLLLLAITLMIMYQYYLGAGLEEYILYAPRVDLLSKNREGVFSLIGYFSIFLIGADLGRRIIVKKPTSMSTSQFNYNRLRTLVLFMSSLALLIYVSTEWLDIPVSRRVVPSSNHRLTCRTWHTMRLCLQRICSFTF
jgi:glucosaminylphosphatidylinositol acyltransferase